MVKYAARDDNNESRNSCRIIALELWTRSVSNSSSLDRCIIKSSLLSIQNSFLVCINLFINLFCISLM